jgi:hypothetical protein
MRTWVVLLVPLAGCLRNTAYQCSTNDQCGAGGVCEGVHYCSFPDPSCGRKFGPQAGMYANQCVNAVVDAGVDGKVDAPRDGAATCPSDFKALTGLPANQLYKWIATPADWMTQRANCAALSSRVVLGYPSSAAELTAMSTLSGGMDYFVGISDLQTMGTWKTTRNTTQTFLPWQGGAPSVNPNADCVDVLVATSTIQNDKCTMTALAAICECE